MTTRHADLEFRLQTPDAQFFRRMVLAWAVIFFAAMAYCLMHGAVTGDFSLHPAIALKWALTKWGGWPLILPLCFLLVRHLERRHSLMIGIMAAAPVAVLGAGLFAYLVRSFDDAPWPLADALFHMTPVAGGTYLLFVVLAFWVLDPVMLRAGTREAVASGPGPIEGLPVAKGKLQTRIPADAVDWVQAARNYVELVAGDQTYIMRASMKEMEELLPGSDFLRLHRSYLVNRRAITGLRRNKKGDPSVVLACGRTLPVGRAYRESTIGALRLGDKAA